jgi:hypothetical protein
MKSSVLLGYSQIIRDCRRNVKFKLAPPQLNQAAQIFTPVVSNKFDL